MTNESPRFPGFAKTLVNANPDAVACRIVIGRSYYAVFSSLRRVPYHPPLASEVNVRSPKTFRLLLGIFERPTCNRGLR